MAIKKYAFSILMVIFNVSAMEVKSTKQKYGTWEEEGIFKALHEKADRKILETIISKNPEEVVNSVFCVNDKKPLACAAQDGHLEAVNLLLEYGANINARDYHKWTALHHAACEGHAEVVKRLIEAGVDINATDLIGYTALHRAIRPDNEAVVKILLKNGAGNSGDHNDKTPLMWAEKDNLKEIARLLKEHLRIRPNSDCNESSDSVLESEQQPLL